jgi:hypothetical protein
MPNGTITSTENTFGTVNGALSGTVAGTLTGSVGVPGPVGPAGPGSTWGGIAGTLSAQTDLWTELGTKYLASNPAGYQTAGQVSTALAPYITSATATASFYPLSGNPSAFLTASALTPYLTSATAASTYQTLAGMSSYLTTSAAAAGYYPLSGNPSGFLTAASLSGYATESFVTSQGYITSAALTPYLLSSTAASTYQTLSGMSSYSTTSAANLLYAPIAAGQPTSGTIGQVLTKNSGTNYDSSWQTLIPGDRYLSTSTTSLAINNANKTLTIGTGLSYTPTQSITISYDASNHMHGEVLTYNSGTGVLTVDINHHTGSGTFASWVVNVGGVVPVTSVTWGSITGTLGDQTDLATALNAKLASADAATTYAPIASPTFTGTVTIPSGASISGFAPLASPALTGNVTITSNSTGAALFIQQAGTGNILTLHDQASDTTFVAIDQNGKVNTIPSEATNGAGLNVPHGVAPTTPVNGDIFTTTSGLFMRQNGTTQQYVDLAGTQTINGTKTFSASSQTLGSGTATGTINVASGATISASTKTVNVGTGGVVGSTTNITVGPVLGASTTSIGGTTAASTLNLATGATLTATTKAVNIGTAGVAGSTTNIVIGSTTGTSTTTLQGITNGVTEAVDTNNTELATTAFVVGQAGSATPLVNGTAAVGTSLRYARQDHVHGTDTTRAPLASPTFTGTPLSTTAAADTNTTQIATTAYVVGNGYLKSATASSTYAPLASPALTGTPTAPTATPGTNTTQIATTAFVLANAPAAPVTSVAGRTGAVTLSTSDISGLGTAATFADTAFLKTANNLSELTATASTARTNLGLGTMSTATASDYSTTTVANGLYYPLTGNPSGFLTSAPVTSVAGRTGAITLANTDISGLGTMATATAADYSTTTVANGLYYPLSSNPAGYLTTAPVASVAGKTGVVTLVAADVSGAAPLASPALTGTPTAPTATGGTNTTQIATTAFVTAAIPTNNVKAWVNFNGTGTVAIRASFNVSSITDNGTGDYTVNMTNALADIDYTAVATGSLDGASTAWTIGFAFAMSTTPFVQAPTTTTARFTFGSTTNTANRLDPQYGNIAIFR